ncbi:MAG: hypothetical protein IJ783_11340 [Kiritimatiellae bacterium]|nr:hypothetical protein [Kiritimatiellia bacterium]
MDFTVPQRPDLVSTRLNAQGVVDGTEPPVGDGFRDLARVRRDGDGPRRGAAAGAGGGTGEAQDGSGGGAFHREAGAGLQVARAQVVQQAV